MLISIWHIQIFKQNHLHYGRNYHSLFTDLLKQEVQLKTCMPCCRGELARWNVKKISCFPKCIMLVNCKARTFNMTSMYIWNFQSQYNADHLLWILEECRLFEIFVLADCWDWRTHRRPKLLKLQKHLRCRRGIPTNTGHAPPKQQGDLFHLPTFTSEWKCIGHTVVEADPKPSEHGQPCTLDLITCSH
jgi:hypothetical protein